MWKSTKSLFSFYRYYSSQILTHRQTRILDPLQQPKPAIFTWTSEHKNEYRYNQFLRDTAVIAGRINATKGSRVAFLFEPGYEYAVTQWAIWRSLAVAVPLCETHPLVEWEYFITQSRSQYVVYQRKFYLSLKPLINKYKDKIQFIQIANIPVTKPEDAPNPLGELEGSTPATGEEDAMIIYTSGTTGKPKGVVLTHKNLYASVSTLCRAWRWTKSDRILHCLPLHHIHGIVNALTCPLYSGASCEFLKFDPYRVWDRFLSGEITVFMGVPTMYVKLINWYENQRLSIRARISRNPHWETTRLFVSGSAPLPDTVFQRWYEITGHKILERYGMSEIGMALSNPYHGERRPGRVGQPLPGVEVKVLDEQGNIVPCGKGSGELYVKGPQVFKEYFDNPKSTQESFKDGWFQTGDIVECDPDDNSYAILGRKSVDIIKSGGYKISAIDIERVLLSHPDIAEVAVVPVEDVEWGQRIGALIVQKEGTSELTLEKLRNWCKDKMANYKIPTLLKIVQKIPRNAMGKVNKKLLIPLFK